MKTSGYVKQDEISAAAGTARLDRRFTGPSRNDWLRQVGGRIRLTINRQIPVGFQDEMGFHLGAQPACKEDRMDWERAGIFLGDRHF